MAQTRNGRFSVTVHVVTASGGEPLPGVRVNFRNLETGNAGYRVSHEDGLCDPYYVAPGTRLSIVPADRRYIFDDPGSLVVTVNSNQEYHFKGAGADLNRLVSATPVFRLQMALATGSREDDETDDDVWVSFQAPPQSKNSEQPGRYFLDSQRDDFQRGTLQVFDVPPSTWGIQTIGDIRDVVVGLRGTDAWCYSTIAVVVNGTIRIPVTVDPLCLDNPGGNSRASLANARQSFRPRVNHDDLTRWVPAPYGVVGALSADAFTQWQDVLDGRAPLVMTRAEVMARLESAVGQRLARFDSMRFFPADPDPPAPLRVTATDCCIDMWVFIQHRESESVWSKVSGIFAIGDLPDPWEFDVTYRVDQRRDRLHQTFLQWVSASGPQPGRGRLFDNQGELFRVLLFEHNHRLAEVLPDGSLRFTFPRRSSRPLPSTPPSLPRH